MWFEAPRAGPREFPYREERPRGTHTDREEAYGAGAGERLRLPVASQSPWRDDGDAENDLLRRRPRESQRVLLTVFLLAERARMDAFSPSSMSASGDHSPRRACERVVIDVVSPRRASR